MHLSLTSSNNIQRHICRRKGICGILPNGSVMNQGSIISTGSPRGKGRQEVFNAQGRETVSARRIVSLRSSQDGRGWTCGAR
jgi:hypothetical protein